MSGLDEKRYIIKGIKECGTKFRPSDWAERMCGNLCTFRNRRMIYSPLLRPAVIDGVKCVIIKSELSEAQPTLFQQIIEFAQKNGLDVIEETLDAVA